MPSKKPSRKNKIRSVPLLTMAEADKLKSYQDVPKILSQRKKSNLKKA